MRRIPTGSSSSCSGRCPTASRSGPERSISTPSWPGAALASEARASSALRRRVLAADLRRRPFLSLLLAIQTRLPIPRALELVADVEAQRAQALRLDLNHVAVLKRAEPAVIGARGEHVTGLERVDRG